MGRSPCCEKGHTNKGAWAKQEDERLKSYINTHGEGCWRSLPKAAGLLRCGKSCRLRWISYLRPDLKRGSFTEEEDHLIIHFHRLLGNKAGPDWNTHIRRKLINRGIDPTTHRPLKLQEPSSQHSHLDSTINISFTCSSSSTSSSSREDSFAFLGKQLAKTEVRKIFTWNHEEKSEGQVEEMFPELNMELRISLPCDHPQRSGNGSLKGTNGTVCGIERMRCYVVGDSADCSEVSTEYDLIGLANN